MELSVQELFPQTGPFAEVERAESKPGRKGKDRPIPRRKKGRSILNVAPGEKVYLVPFNTTGKLVRIDSEKDVAIVLRGAFEIELPLSDVAPAK